MTFQACNLSRRTMLATGAAAAAMGASGVIRENASAIAAAPSDWLALLGKSEKGGRSAAPRVEGNVPSGINGALFRNGPGLFERGGVRKRHLLDGDGLIQKLAFTDGQVSYKNAFVQTPKFLAEAKADRFLHATWTTRKPGGVFANMGGGISESQAGVTIYPVHGKIIARDEIGANFSIDPDSLDTLAQIPCGDPEQGAGVGFKAHSKLDPKTGAWLIGGQQYGRNMSLHTVHYSAPFKLVGHHAFEAPRQVYTHDFFVTDSYFIFVLHPCNFSPFGFLAGLNSFTDALTWAPQDGNMVAVVPRAGGDPQYFEAPAAFMWHALNAYEENGEIIADFVGYDEPDHFIGENAMFHTLMSGKRGLANAKGAFRRYLIQPGKGTLREEILDAGNHEFPMSDPRVHFSRHRTGYFSSGGEGGLNSAVKRLDMADGAAQEFDFGPKVHVGEPVFIHANDHEIDQGWLITQCLDGTSGTTFFALFDAQTVAQGPVAKLWLDHHVPISFHGAWVSAG